MLEQTVAQLLDDHVVLDIEGIDRIYLNAYQPRLQSGGGAVAFFKGHREATVASTALMAPMSAEFVRNIRNFAEGYRIPVVRFDKGQRKDEETQRRLKDFQGREGVLYIGVRKRSSRPFG